MRDDLRICCTCFGLYGGSGTDRQLCRCSSREEYEALGAARNQRNGSPWQLLAVICKCCGAELLDARHQLSQWFCTVCFRRAFDVNRAVGYCAIPVGWHSIRNGVFATAKSTKTRAGATAFADQLNSHFREARSVESWGDHIIERHWNDAGLAIDHDVPTADYLSAVRANGIDKQALFEELAVARNVPPRYWPNPEVLVLTAAWYRSGDGRYLEAHEQVIWCHPEGGVKNAPLLLRVASGRKGVWIWGVTIDQAAIGDGASTLAGGVASTQERARKECETAATALILGQQRRFAS